MVLSYGINVYGVTLPTQTSTDQDAQGLLDGRGGSVVDVKRS